ncbi:MAG: gspG [Patescibacteria group bacterium]|nr:gspG [Patescibacteria group bacterium]
MNNNSHKGFTLIELLVVVAIIALLAATILASLGGARSKAKDARITSELSSLRAQMEQFYNSNGFSYVDPSGPASVASCASGPFATGTDNTGILIKDIGKQTGDGTNYYYMYCAADKTSWAVAALLPGTGKTFCVDSNGVSKAGVDVNGVPSNSPINTLVSNPYRCW